MRSVAKDLVRGTNTYITDITQIVQTLKYPVSVTFHNFSFLGQHRKCEKRLYVISVISSIDVITLIKVIFFILIFFLVIF